MREMHAIRVVRHDVDHEHVRRTADEDRLRDPMSIHDVLVHGKAAAHVEPAPVACDRLRPDLAAAHLNREAEIHERQVGLCVTLLKPP